MCGIVGCLALALEADPDQGWVQTATERISHRGPDDEGFYTDPDVALGFRRLAIIDLSPGGHQPMRSADGRYWMVYNGEIYNYLELGQELRQQGVALRSSSDSEVLLEMYARVGKDVVHRLRGMFAFAIWDTWTRELFCARDQFGIKPFYYTIDQAPAQAQDWAGGAAAASKAGPAGRLSSRAGLVARRLSSRAGLGARRSSRRGLVGRPEQAAWPGGAAEQPGRGRAGRPSSQGSGVADRFSSRPGTRRLRAAGTRRLRVAGTRVARRPGLRWPARQRAAAAAGMPPGGANSPAARRVQRPAAPVLARRGMGSGQLGLVRAGSPGTPGRRPGPPAPVGCSGSLRNANAWPVPVS